MNDKKSKYEYTANCVQLVHQMGELWCDMLSVTHKIVFVNGRVLEIVKKPNVMYSRKDRIPVVPFIVIQATQKSFEVQACEMRRCNQHY